MSPVARAFLAELLAELRRDPTMRTELRRALALEDQAPELLTIGAAAKVASVTSATVGRWLRSGQLAASGRGKRCRIARADLEAFLLAGGPRVAPGQLGPEDLADAEEAVSRSGPSAGALRRSANSHALARPAAAGGARGPRRLGGNA